MERFLKFKNQEHDMKDRSSPMNYAEGEYKLTNEMRDEEIVANFFDSQTETYGLSSIPFDQFLADFQKKRILHEFTNTRGLILDVGTGWGRYAIELTKIGLEVVGMDISREMLKAALAIRERKSIHYLVQGTALRLPFKDNTFDGVFFVRSLKYIEDYYDVLDEASRVLQYKGKLVIYDVGNILSYIAFPHIYKKLFKKENALPYYKFSIFSLKKYLRDNGFEDIIVNGYLHIPMLLYRKIENKKLLNTIFKIEKIIDMILPSGLLSYAFIISAKKIR